jgi:hypothetical protein
VIDPDEPALTAWELRAGHYVQVTHVRGVEEYAAQLPFPLVVCPARLVTD